MVAQNCLLIIKANLFGFTVVTKDGLQYDFSCEVEEWQQLKSFIEQAISSEGKNKTRTNSDEMHVALPI